MRETVPTWTKPLTWFADTFIFKAAGTPVIKLAWAVNFHKIITLFLTFFMMVFYDNFTDGAWVYLALHGIYGYCWLIKDLGFRDHQLEEKMSVLGVVGLYVFLIGLYWLIPWLFISRQVIPTGPELFVAIAVHTLGVTTMISADGQRHFCLKHKKGLITYGMYKYTRNPNYLGETMIYASYAFLAQHWLAWVIVGYMTFGVFLPRLYNKDHAISRHEGWADYKKQSSLLIPWALINGRAIKDMLQRKDDI